jgi:hypothetical protein
MAYQQQLENNVVERAGNMGPRSPHGSTYLLADFVLEVCCSNPCDKCKAYNLEFI